MVSMSISQSLPAHPSSRPISNLDVRRSPRLRAINKGFKRDFAAMHNGTSLPRQTRTRAALRSSSSGGSQGQSSSRRSVNQALPNELVQHLQRPTADGIPDPIPLQVLQTTGVSFCGLAPMELEADKLDDDKVVPHDDTTEA